MDLTMAKRFVDTTVVVAPAGEVDLASAEQFREGLVAAEAEADASMVIDLRNVGFMDSTGIGELVGCLRRCRAADVSLSFVVPDGTIRKILHVTGMDQVFDMHHDESAAIASVASND
jgi:anti-sigma B factor antagonist